MLHKNTARTQNNILINKTSNARKSKDTEFFIFCSHVSIASSTTKERKKERKKNNKTIQLAPEFVPMPFGTQFQKNPDPGPETD